MCALLCVLSSVLSYVCSPLCALSSVLSYVCSPLCALICVLSYACYHMCALMCSHMSAPLCSHLCVIVIIITTTSLASFSPPHCLGSLAGIIFSRDSEGTLESFVVPFGRLFGTKLGGVLVWRRGSSFASFRGSGSSSSWCVFFVTFEKLSPGVGGRAAALKYFHEIHGILLKSITS